MVSLLGSFIIADLRFRLCGSERITLGCLPFLPAQLVCLRAEGAVAGEVKFILYKGNHYHLQIRTETGYDLYVDTDDIWDKGDQVGIRILPKDIKAVKK